MFIEKKREILIFIKKEREGVGVYKKGERVVNTNN